MKQELFGARVELETQNYPLIQKCPILMPREHYVTRLIVLQCHKDIFHAVTNETFTELRSKFWVIKGRKFIKVTIRPCVTCKRLQGKSFGVPAMSDIPEFRVVKENAFSSVDIDFAGPLYIKATRNEISKIYIYSFIYLHLEQSSTSRHCRRLNKPVIYSLLSKTL